MAWIILIFAGILEALWVVGLKISEGLTKPLWAIFTILAMIFSMYFLALASKTIPVGTAYAIWVGIGVFSSSLIGMIFWEESHSIFRILSLFLIIAGVVGLKVS